jgi:glycosyltransferase involved in cell wall biosynthesis
MRRICIIPNVSGTGGMVSFRHKLEAGLSKEGVGSCFNLEDEPYQSVLVIGGSRHLAAINSIKKKGVRIVQRLDGINWIQRRKFTGLRHTIRSEYGNLLQSTIRRNLADHIIYQSKFAKTWWEEWYGETNSPNSIILNGVDLDAYTPSGPHDKPSGKFRLLVVEGSLAGGYENGLKNAVELVVALQKRHHLPMELMVVGSVSQELKSAWDDRHLVPIIWNGKVPRESIPAIDRSAHILYAADLHPACPNSVIEAMACGLPVAAFDTGAIRELIPEDAGCVVPYGSDPWKLQQPDIEALADKVAPALLDIEPYRKAARNHAEKFFDLVDMVKKYLEVLLEEDDE